MRSVAAALAALAFSVPASANSTADTAQPTLTLIRAAPVTIGGSRFVPRERVRVSVVAAERRHSKHVIADARGRFTVRFATLFVERCGVLVASAVGARGSRAGLKLPQLLCPPPL